MKGMAPSIGHGRRKTPAGWSDPGIEEETNSGVLEIETMEVGRRAGN